MSGGGLHETGRCSTLARVVRPRAQFISRKTAHRIRLPPTAPNAIGSCCSSLRSPEQEEPVVLQTGRIGSKKHSGPLTEKISGTSWPSRAVSGTKTNSVVTTGMLRPGLAGAIAVPNRDTRGNVVACGQMSGEKNMFGANDGPERSSRGGFLPGMRGCSRKVAPLLQGASHKNPWLFFEFA